MQKLVIRKVAASVEWWHQEYRLYYSYQQANSFIENLHIVSKVIEMQAKAMENGEISLDDFNRSFAEDKDVDQQRKDARKLLGVEEDCLDLTLINKKYKLLAMKHHPDRPQGNHEIFKKINNAHKILKRELN